MLFLIFLELYDLPGLAGIKKYLFKWNLREEDWVKFILNPKVIVDMSNNEIFKKKSF